ncbi:MAG: hypothetical protein JXL97_08390 [Bacteroidales bacterium]|nr:hypothetical protein [Bacteroidales bacterium]
MNFIKNQTLKLQQLMSKSYTEIGKILFETQKELSNNKTGIFEAWYTEIGFSKKQVYRLINRYNFILCHADTIKKAVEMLPITLSYELTNPMCPEELRNKILNNEIKNLKDFYEKQKNLQMENVVPELLNVEENFENDVKIFKKNFNKLNKIVNENFDKISKEKKENLAKEIEFLNKKIEKLLKEFN